MVDVVNGRTRQLRGLPHEPTDAAMFSSCIVITRLSRGNMSEAPGGDGGTIWHSLPPDMSWLPVDFANSTVTGKIGRLD